MILDVPVYEEALARERLRLGVTFDETKHPRLHGRFAKKGLGEGLTAPTKGRVTNRAPTSAAYTPQQNMSPFKSVEHKKINDLVRKAGESGKPLPKEGHDGFFTKAGPYGSTEYDLASTDFELGLQTTKKDMVVLRAVAPDAVKDKKIGDSWIDHGFVSTSMTAEGNKNTTDHFSTFKGKKAAYLKIHVPKGTHAHDYGHKDADRELVLDRGLEYTVTGEERDHDGNRVLLVKVS